MDWITVIGLILFGLGLIIIEIIFVPGTTIVGIGGVLFCGFGVYLSYDYFGNTTGTIILVISSLAGIGMLVYALKSRAWERFSLKEENTGKFNDDFKVTLAVGDEGMTISPLKPIGKAIFNEKDLEVRSNGGYIEENKPIKIIRIEANRIIVELKK